MTLIMENIKLVGLYSSNKTDRVKEILSRDVRDFPEPNKGGGASQFIVIQYIHYCYTYTQQASGERTFSLCHRRDRART